jgi:CubicO group peptidase (beta-lactamase class C family)
MKNGGRQASCRLAFVMLCLSTAPAASGQQVVDPDAEWQPAPSGLAPEVRHRVDQYVPGLDTTGLMVVQHGLVVYQYGDLQVLSYSASTRKSILAMLYGRYVADGTIRLERTLKDLRMSDVGGLLPIEERARIVDLISARSGVYHAASYSGDNLDSAPMRGSHEPGSYWLYSNWDFNAAGAAFEQLTGKNIYDALRDDLAVPIGMQDFRRARQRKDGDLTRSQYAAYPMWLSTRDTARLSYLMLRRGRWRNRQVIPEEWVRRMTSVVTPRAQLNPAGYREGPFGYGYMWWVWDEPHAIGPFKGAYTSWGKHGQFFTVLPELDMVVAHKTIPVNRELTIVDYLRLLDRIVGRSTASEEILPVLWRKGEEEAFELASRLKSQPQGRIADEGDLYTSGVALLRAGQARQSERVLMLNARLYPNSFRTLIALSRSQAAAGQISEALESARKALALEPHHAFVKVQLARLGAPVDGHTPIELPLDKTRPLTGVYLSKGTRYAVERQDEHLLIRVYREEELDEEFECFADKSGAFFAPADGTLIRFEVGANGVAEAMDGTVKETWHATRSQ